MVPSLKRIIAVSTVVLFTLGLSAIWIGPVDIHVGSQHTDIGHTLSTATVSHPNGLLVKKAGVDILVLASGYNEIDDALAQQLKERLSRQLTAEHITLSTTLDRQHPSASPLLLIEMTEREITWTPILANAKISTEVVYASDGDVSWRNEVGMIMQHNEPTVHARGRITLTDESRGLLSQYGYQKHLGEALGDEIYKMIESPFFAPPGS